MNNSEILYYLFGANLDPITFGNLVSYYYNNAYDYNISENSDYYRALKDCWYLIVDENNRKEWKVYYVIESEIYKQYLQVNN